MNFLSYKRAAILLSTELQATDGQKSTSRETVTTITILIRLDQLSRPGVQFGGSFFNTTTAKPCKYLLLIGFSGVIGGETLILQKRTKINRMKILGQLAGIYIIQNTLFYSVKL